MASILSLSALSLKTHFNLFHGWPDKHCQSKPHGTHCTDVEHLNKHSCVFSPVQTGALHLERMFVIAISYEVLYSYLLACFSSRQPRWWHRTPAHWLDVFWGGLRLSTQFLEKTTACSKDSFHLETWYTLGICQSTFDQPYLCGNKLMEHLRKWAYSHSLGLLVAQWGLWIPHWRVSQCRREERPSTASAATVEYLQEEIPKTTAKTIYV